jgi:4'-phosphopantetheinyl transferase
VTAPAVPDTPPLRGCQVWWARLDQVRPWHDRLLAPVERERREAMRHQDGRDRFTLGVALSRLLLAGHLGTPPGRLAIDRTCPSCGGPHGRPRLVGVPGAVDFSVSHAGARVVVALARAGAVGVDVEELARGERGVAVSRMALSPAERDVLAALAPPRQGAAFVRYWTRKEAAVKATGDGITAGLRRVVVSGPDEPARLVAWEGRPDLAGRLELHDVGVGRDGYLACLAVLDAPGQPVGEYDAGPLLEAGRLAGA